MTSICSCGKWPQATAAGEGLLNGQLRVSNDGGTDLFHILAASGQFSNAIQLFGKLMAVKRTIETVRMKAQHT